MQNTTPVIGIDLGATNLRVGLVDNGKITALEKGPLPKDKSVMSILNTMCEMIETVDKGATSIGIGVPSVVDSKEGIVYDVQNIPGWEKVHLKDLLEEKTGKSVYLNNDANCFALGENMFGEGKGKKNLVGLIIGTGFAGGIILDGKIYEGRNCGAGEFGMIPYKQSILEHYCSGQFFSKLVGVNGEEIYEKALNDDPASKKLFQEFGTHVAEAIKIVLYTYDPECIILGGSISSTFDQFKDGFERELKTFGFPNSLNHVEITVSKTQHIAVLGAAALTHNHPIKY
ncbi:ROK family protein [Rhodohalobacter sp. 614A]|uniref:ROK family protein n=1 Tax=Rhodohalobacter sp. 614A TaxID=2908649 RepID=UPI001F3AE634|nr:ROK family protein [Rhodohalobacter sp. 614A]